MKKNIEIIKLTTDTQRSITEAALKTILTDYKQPTVSNDYSLFEYLYVDHLNKNINYCVKHSGVYNKGNKVEWEFLEEFIDRVERLVDKSYFNNVGLRRMFVKVGEDNYVYMKVEDEKAKILVSPYSLDIGKVIWFDNIKVDVIEGYKVTVNY